MGVKCCPTRQFTTLTSTFASWSNDARGNKKKGRFSEFSKVPLEIHREYISVYIYIYRFHRKIQEKSYILITTEYTPAALVDSDVLCRGAHALAVPCNLGFALMCLQAVLLCFKI